METPWSRILGDAIGALAAGDAGLARGLFDQLEMIAGSFAEKEERSLSSAWEPFVRLLHRRGYFVSSPHLLGVALQEIREMGPGFDLYDLATALARCDAQKARRLQVAESRVFPELRSFAPDQLGTA